MRAVGAALAQVQRVFGNLHVLCNNAGVASRGLVQNASYDDWDWTLGVNIGGVPLQTKEWAFWALLGMFVVGVATQFYFFRRRGWLKRD